MRVIGGKITTTKTATHLHTGAYIPEVEGDPIGRSDSKNHQRDIIVEREAEYGRTAHPWNRRARTPETGDEASSR